MLNKIPYEYTIFRLVPRVEREEFINIGVILFCKKINYLNATIHLDEARALSLFPGIDIHNVQTYIEALEKIVIGDSDGGPIATLDKASRYRWLTAQRSTLIQSSPTHCGITENIDSVFTSLVKDYLL